MLQMVLGMLLLIAGLYFSPILYVYNLLLSSPFYFVSLFFSVSMNVTIILRLLYLFFSNFLLETSDSEIRRNCTYVKIWFFSISILLDQFIESFQNENLAFFFLSSGSTDVGPIKTGLGFFLNVILLLTLIVFNQIKASQINGDQRYATKGARLLSAIFFAFFVLFFLRTQLFKVEDIFFVYACILILIYFFIFNQILPYYFIQGNENMRKYFIDLLPESLINVIE